MSCREFSHWLAYDKMEPLEPTRTEYMLAQIAQLIHNSNCKKGKEQPLKEVVICKDTDKANFGKPRQSPGMLFQQLSRVLGAPQETYKIDDDGNRVPIPNNNSDDDGNRVPIPNNNSKV